jgi:glutamine cyclotransferase
LWIFSILLTKQFHTFASILKATPMNKYFFLIGLIILSACTGNPPQNDDSNGNTSTVSMNNVPAPQNINVNIVNIYPHDTSAFTEGLQIYNGKLYEGTGDFENSALQISDIKTGKVLQKHKMGTPEIFGEGIDVFKGKIYQLTWKNNIVYVYDEKNINKPIKTFSWPYEGWGMTNDGTDLIIDDGQPSGYLYYVDPDNFKIVKTITVQDNYGPVDNLNELEYINGSIYANEWMTDLILKIDPANGYVVAKINCAGILQQAAPKEYNDPNFDKNANVLNGIAWDSTIKKMYITGKRWPKLFEISLN